MTLYHLQTKLTRR